MRYSLASTFVRKPHALLRDEMLFDVRVLFCTNALWTCRAVLWGGTEVSSDGDDGPDDGVNHVHPEKPFHFDCFLDIGGVLLTCDF